MPRRRYYIPLRDDDFFIFQGNLVNQVVANKVAWGIPDAAVTALTDRRAEYEPLYHKAQNKTTRTRVDVLAHRQSRKLYEKEIRVFVKAYLFNPLVTDEARMKMGIPPRDTEPSPRPKISDIPIVGLESMGGGDIEVRCRGETDQTRDSMLRAADVIECRYVLAPVGQPVPSSGTDRGEMPARLNGRSGGPPDDPESMAKTQTSKKARFIIQAGAKGIGQRFYGFFRWANLTNPANSGPWTNAQSVVIA